MVPELLLRVLAKHQVPCTIGAFHTWKPYRWRWLVRVRCGMRWPVDSVSEHIACCIGIGIGITIFYCSVGTPPLPYL